MGSLIGRVADAETARELKEQVLEDTEFLKDRSKEASKRLVEVKVKAEILQKNFTELTERVNKLEDGGTQQTERDQLPTERAQSPAEKEQKPADKEQ